MTLTVMRAGGAHGEASVRYATGFGTALDGVNYGNTYGVLEWADGDSSAKSISVPILAAAPFSGDKTLTLILSSPAGATLGAIATASISIIGGGTAALAAAGRSIGGWVSCNGTTDDQAGVARAFAAARNGAFTLIVDCPVFIHVGTDIARTIFIDNGTTVQFTASGKFILDNTFIPTFAIADSSNITLSGWNIEYRATLGVDPNAHAYLKGQLLSNGSTKPGNDFNDITLTDWLASNRGIVFKDYVKSNWSGSTNACALIFITGDSSALAVSNMQVAVPATSGGESFVPVVFTLAQNFKAQQTVGAGTPMTSEYVSLPHDLTFNNVTLDGIYMGWVGNARNATFSSIVSKRYGDLQDASGAHVGGIGKWFAPPHLFYLSSSASSDPLLVNSNIAISGVTDLGVRVGSARDRGGSDSISGYALSLKIACNSCTVDGYASARPDGLMDVLASSNLTIENVSASYDSSFLNDLYPGWRFPSAPYANVTFRNVSLTDKAARSVQAPIGDAGMTSNSGLVFANVQATLNTWAGPAATPLPAIAGSGLSLSLDYLITQRSMRLVRAQTDAVQTTLQVLPATLPAGGRTELSWTSRGAGECAATGAWSGSRSPSGASQVTLQGAGSYDFSLGCAGAQDAANPASALVVVN